METCFHIGLDETGPATCKPDWVGPAHKEYEQNLEKIDVNEITRKMGHSLHNYIPGEIPLADD